MATTVSAVRDIAIPIQDGGGHAVGIEFTVRVTNSAHVRALRAKAQAEGRSLEQYLGRRIGPQAECA